MITVVARNRDDNVAKMFHRTMMRDRVMCEIIIVNKDIENEYRIEGVPAAIFSSGKVIYEKEMREMILAKGGVKTMEMI